MRRGWLVGTIGVAGAVAAAGLGAAYLGEGPAGAHPDTRCARVSYLSGHSFEGHSDTRASAVLAAVRAARAHNEHSGMLMVRFC